MNTANFNQSKFDLPRTKRQHDKTRFASLERCWVIEDQLVKLISSGGSAEIEALIRLAAVLVEELNGFAEQVGGSANSPFAWPVSDHDAEILAAMQKVFPAYQSITAHPPALAAFNDMHAALPRDSTIDEQVRGTLSALRCAYMDRAV